MSNFQFAIASILDAHTGHGLVHRDGRIDYAAAASHGRAIRSRTIVELFGLFTSRLGKTIASIRERQAEKRKVRQLARLNDHILADIGITRGDVIALQMGQVDIRQLEAQRSRKSAATYLQHSASTRRVGDTARRNALNEAVFARAKCA